MKTDKERHGLIGQVKTVELYSNVTDLSIHIVSYDIKGNKVEEIFESGYQRGITTYDENNQKIKTTYYGIVAYKEVDDRLEKLDIGNNNSLAGWEDYTYNKNEELAECISYANDGSIITKRLYAFDEKDNLIEVKICNKEGKINDRNLHSYNDKGVLVESKLISNLNNEERSSEDKYSFTYDANGNEVERYHYFNGRIVVRYKFRYELDSVGNWVKQHYHIINVETDEEESGILHRKIIYY